jgi:hypothetical protein
VAAKVTESPGAAAAGTVAVAPTAHAVPLPVQAETERLPESFHSMYHSSLGARNNCPLTLAVNSADVPTRNGAPVVPMRPTSAMRGAPAIGTLGPEVMSFELPAAV